MFSRSRGDMALPYWNRKVVGIVDIPVEGCWMPWEVSSIEGRRPSVAPVGQAASQGLAPRDRQELGHLGESPLDSRNEGLQPQAHLGGKSCQKSQKPWIHQRVLTEGKQVGTPRCTMVDPG